MYIQAQDHQLWNLELAHGILIHEDLQKQTTTLVLDRPDLVQKPILATLPFVGGRTSKPLAEKLTTAIHSAMARGDASLNLEEELQIWRRTE